MIAAFKWTVLVVSVVVLAILFFGAAYEHYAEASDLDAFPAPGQMIRARGHLMHLYCEGNGTPTVLFEQGLNGVVSAWLNIIHAVGQRTRACGYDRAGLGYSEPVDRPTRAVEVAGNLQALLEAAEIDGPLILVGWSAGGIYVREYYRQFPARVAAMVLVESSHEQQSLRLPPGRQGMDPMIRVAQYLAPFGLIRMSGIARERVVRSRTPDILKPRLVALYERSDAPGAMIREAEGLAADLLAGTPPSSLGDLPLVVITGAKPAEEIAGESPDSLAAFRRHRAAWYTLQDELVALSTDSQHIFAKHSEHAIHLDEPGLLIHAVTDLVDRVRERAHGRRTPD